MGKIEQLVEAYTNFVKLPWTTGIAGPQRVWFAIYKPNNERQLRYRLGEFDLATTKAGYNWAQCDLTNLFANWMAEQDYRDSYFEAPEDINLALQDFKEYCCSEVRSVITRDGVDENTVVGIYGAASLFGLIKLSEIIEEVARFIRGRLLVLFPGDYDNGSYRLLDAQDSWNYLAVPIMISGGEDR